MVEIQMHWVTDLLVLANLQPAALCVCVCARALPEKSSVISGSVQESLSSSAKDEHNGAGTWKGGGV